MSGTGYGNCERCTNFDSQLFVQNSLHNPHDFSKLTNCPFSALCGLLQTSQQKHKKVKATRQWLPFPHSPRPNEVPRHTTLSQKDSISSPCWRWLMVAGNWKTREKNDCHVIRTHRREMEKLGGGLKGKNGAEKKHRRVSPRAISHGSIAIASSFRNGNWLCEGVDSLGAPRTPSRVGEPAETQKSEDENENYIRKKKTTKNRGETPISSSPWLGHSRYKKCGGLEDACRVIRQSFGFLGTGYKRWSQSF